ncbi:MAG: PIN domain nuclease [Microlunatus sp.]|nr:PIN domain nuclease [Microlunatus sp.]MDN5769393.1 PIN domain nuclease [Microlunatus sp.]
MIVVDSSVWIDYFNGTDHPAVDRLDALLDRELIVVGDLILTEVLQGFRRDADFRSARDALHGFTQASMVGPQQALRAAENHRTLRRRGCTVRKTIDTLIATYCIDHDHPLLFSDRDFQPFVDHLGLPAA